MDAQGVKDMAEALRAFALKDYPRDADGSRPLGGAAIDQAAGMLDAYGSILAAAESSGDSVVSELRALEEDSVAGGYAEAVSRKAIARILADAQEKERIRAELASVKAERDGLANAMLEAERDFHGKKVLFSSRYLQLLDAYRAAHPKDAP